MNLEMPTATHTIFRMAFQLIGGLQFYVNRVKQNPLQDWAHAETEWHHMRDPWAPAPLMEWRHPDGEPPQSSDLEYVAHVICFMLDPMDSATVSHAFRAWACSWAAAHGADSSQVRVLKGDRLPGAVDMYDDQARQLPDLYRRFGPKLGIGTSEFRPGRGV